MDRRSVFTKGTPLVLGASVLALAGCSEIQSIVDGAGTAAGTAAVQQLEQDAQAAISSFSAILIAAGTYLPKTGSFTLTALQGYLTTASSALSAFVGGATSVSSTGTSAVQKIETALQSVAAGLVQGFQAASAPSSWVTAAATVAALVPAISAFISGLTTAVSTAPTAAMVAPIMSVHSARAALGVPTVG